MESTNEAVPCPHSVPNHEPENQRHFDGTRSGAVYKKDGCSTAQSKDTTRRRARSMYQGTEPNHHTPAAHRLAHSELAELLLTHRRPTNHRPSISLIHLRIRHAHGTDPWIYHELRLSLPSAMEKPALEVWLRRKYSSSNHGTSTVFGDICRRRGARWDGHRGQTHTHFPLAS